MLTDEQVVTQLGTLCRLGRRLDTKIIVLLGEVEERRLDLKAACSSLFDFCRRKLGMSVGTANRRVIAVRLVRRFPVLLDRLKYGFVTLSALEQIKGVLTEANLEEVLAKVSGKTRDQIDQVVACLAPKPDVPASMTMIPSTSAPSNPDEVATATETTVSTDAPAPSAPLPRGRMASLSEARWRLQLTADQSLHDRIERARDLMRHRNVNGDLTVIVSAAIDALLEKLEAPRKEKTPRRRRSIKEGDVAAATIAAVFVRDGEQCTYVSDQGERCPAKAFLQIDHIDARALGGSGELPNVRVRCRAHNLLYAEEVFGRGHIEARIRQRRSRKTTASTAERIKSTGEPRAGP